jgi:hypothetical protein
MSERNGFIKIDGNYVFLVLTEQTGQDFTFYLQNDREARRVRDILRSQSGEIESLSLPPEAGEISADDQIKGEHHSDAGPRSEKVRHRDRYSYACRLCLLRPILQKSDLKRDDQKRPLLLQRLADAWRSEEQTPYEPILKLLPETKKNLDVVLPGKNDLINILLKELNDLLKNGGLQGILTTPDQFTGDEKNLADQIIEAGARRRIVDYLRLCALFESELKPLKERVTCGRVLAALSYGGKVWSLSFREQDTDSGYQPGTSTGNNLNSIEELSHLLYEELFYVVGRSEIIERTPLSEKNAAAQPKSCSQRMAEHRGEKLQELSGLVVITGSTNSAKSLVTRGLIDLYLTHLKESGSLGRRPHLITYENPIERHFTADTYTPSNDHPQLDVAMSALAKEIDYTPRQHLIDVGPLTEALTEALRQTPKVLFVGETRDKKDWRALVDFASTGHLVITTAHAGSLVEAMHKIFEATRATTPADRAEVAGRLLAVVHLKRTDVRLERPDDADLKYGVLVPALWRRVPRGLNALTADGLASVLPHSFSDADDPCSCLGRTYAVGQLLELAQPRFSEADYEWLKEHLNLKAIDWDLDGA